MWLSSAVSFLSVIYFTSVLVIAVLANVYPYLPKNGNDPTIDHSESSNSTIILEIDHDIMTGLLVSQFISFFMDKF